MGNSRRMDDDPYHRGKTPLCICKCKKNFKLHVFMQSYILHCKIKAGENPIEMSGSDLCIPRNETARPRSQFLDSCICERFIYS